jgi:hypothetical protein
VERMGNKNPNHPIHRRPLLCLFRYLHVHTFPTHLTYSDTFAPIISHGCPIMGIVLVRNSQLFSDVPYFPHISSFSSDFTQLHTNVKVVSVQIELSVLEKLPSIQNSQMERLQKILMRMALSTRQDQRDLQMAKVPLQQEVDGFRRLRVNGG